MTRLSSTAVAPRLSIRDRIRRGNERPVWMEKPKPTTQVVKAVALIVICFLAIYPLFAVLATSLSSQAEIAANNGLVVFPKAPTLDAYRTIFSGGVVTDALVRSLLITVIGTTLSIAVTVAMAYGLTRRDLVGGKFFLMLALFTMLFSPGIIPSFLMVKEMGLMNSYAALVLPTLMSAFNLVVVRSFFMNMPQELFEAAKIDGAGDFRILIQMVLPLSKGVIAVVGLFYGVGYWNAFFNAMLYMDSDKWPLSMILRQYVLLGQPMGDAVAEIAVPSQAIQMAVVVVSLIPVVIVFPFLQKFFTKGVLTGAIKG
ncbi:carbohydrate ABC transporter permease [Arthrobacter sp. GMC3]|uniref:carbohydrate ABC transporter permease n=1 Tax=Arthrobacter sp. GMC3 TaxID=2058894 RepID=UPI0021570EA8|nr:carbohydrate ABC transporter permease [Arthrobacter sp. GMC3]